MSYFKKFGTLETNYSQFEVDGTYKANGTATTFDDVRVSGLGVVKQGSADPGFALFKEDGAGSHGVFLNWFDPNDEEEVFFAIQLPHHYKEGTSIYPHVHWVPANDGGLGEFVKWGLEYTWANIDEVHNNNTQIVYTDASAALTATTSGDGTMAKDKHYVSEFSSIAQTPQSTNGTISSMLICRLFRNATDATDDFPHDAGLLEIDFHIEQDTLGSRSAWLK
jgi:hypothetical protein